MLPEAILFRCDGDAHTGLGHVSRCLALAEALEERGVRSLFFGHYGPDALALLRAVGVEVRGANAATGCSEDLDETLRAARTANAVVLDSYEVDGVFVERIEQKLPVLVVDDFARVEEYNCSGVLNFRVGAPSLRYRGNVRVKMLGPNYFLARRRIRYLRRACPARPDMLRNVLVAIAGVDRHDSTIRVVSALARLDNAFRVRAVLGMDSPQRCQVESIMAELAPGSRVLSRLPDLAEELASAHFCVCGGGLTKYECAYLGIPAGTIAQSEDQYRDTVEFCAVGLALDFGLAWELSDGDITSGILRLMEDSALRSRLAAAGPSVFPEDAPGNAADGLLVVTARGAGGLS